MRFQRWVTALCLLAGAGVVAYRNDYLLHVAKSARIESSYLALERKYLGGAPEGTLRSVQGMMGTTTTVVQKWTLPTETVALGGAGAASTGLAPHNSDNPGTLPKVNAPTTDAPNTSAAVDDGVGAGRGAGTPVDSGRVKGESEPTLRSDERSRASRDSSSVSGASVSSSKYTKTTPEDSTSNNPGVSKAFRESLASYKSRKRDKGETSEPSETKTQARSEPAPSPGTDDFLHMNMRQAIKKKSADSSASSGITKKKRASKADYDPLNGDI